MKISSWQRHDPNAMPPAAKGTGMYINSSMAKVEALKAGYDEAILLSPQGYVSECTGENIFIVRDGVIITPPVAPARSRASPRTRCMTIARDLGIEYRAEPTSLRTDLYTADEAFLSGTAAEVVPIRSVDDREIGEPGPMTRKHPGGFFAAVRGEVDQYKDWNEHVTRHVTASSRRDLRHHPARRLAARGHLAHRRRQAAHRRAARPPRRALHRGRLAGRQPEGRRVLPARARPSSTSRRRRWWRSARPGGRRARSTTTTRCATW